MAIIDSMKNDSAVLNKLIGQIDTEIGRCEDGMEGYIADGQSSMCYEHIKFLKHIRLVLGGPIDQPSNIIPLRKASA